MFTLQILSGTKRDKILIMDYTPMLTLYTERERERHDERQYRRERERGASGKVQ